jgi:hypothetical protein
MECTPAGFEPSAGFLSRAVVMECAPGNSVPCLASCTSGGCCRSGKLMLWSAPLVLWRAAAAKLVSWSRRRDLVLLSMRRAGHQVGSAISREPRGHAHYIFEESARTGVSPLASRPRVCCGGAVMDVSRPQGTPGWGLYMWTIVNRRGTQEHDLRLQSLEPRRVRRQIPSLTHPLPSRQFSACVALCPFLLAYGLAHRAVASWHGPHRQVHAAWAEPVVGRERQASSDAFLRLVFSRHSLDPQFATTSTMHDVRSFVLRGWPIVLLPRCRILSEQALARCSTR